MGRSTVTGNAIADFGFRIGDCRKGDAAFRFVNPRSAIRNPQWNGFTLLELMIVISIIIILAVIAMPQYQKTVVLAKETVLRDDLFQFRKVIDMYAADKGKLPQSLQDLVDSGYMREIPVDPTTDSNETWQPVMGEDANSIDGGQGITDVHSGSPDKSSEGTQYNEW